MRKKFHFVIEPKKVFTTLSDMGFECFIAEIIGWHYWPSFLTVSLLSNKFESSLLINWMSFRTTNRTIPASTSEDRLAKPNKSFTKWLSHTINQSNCKRSFSDTFLMCHFPLKIYLAKNHAHFVKGLDWISGFNAWNVVLTYLASVLTKRSIIDVRFERSDAVLRT